MACSNQQMSNPNPNEPLTRNPHTTPQEGVDTDDAQISDEQERRLVDPEEKQAAADDDIVGPDGEHG
jgi:hypothetical protein